MRILPSIVLMLCLTVVFAESAVFDYQIDSIAKLLNITITRPGERVLGGSIPGLIWKARLRLFTKSPLSGTALLNPQLKDLDWAEVRKSAETGNPEAAYLLAHKLIAAQQFNGQAAYWLERAAAAGHGPSENDLGVLAMYGLGVTRDVSRAVRMFQKAARRDVAMGHLNLGICQMLGLGSRRNYRSAKSHIERAAKQKLALAEVLLAVNHTVGTQIANRDFKRAYELVLLARAHGTGWSLGDGRNSRNWYYIGIEKLEAYLEQRIPDRERERIQRRMSAIFTVGSPNRPTLVERIQSHAPRGSSEVLVIGPDEPSSEPLAETP
jgi:hypothetical protein